MHEPLVEHDTDAYQITHSHCSTFFVEPNAEKACILGGELVRWQLRQLYGNGPWTGCFLLPRYTCVLGAPIPQSRRAPLGLLLRSGEF